MVRGGDSARHVAFLDHVDQGCALVDGAADTTWSLVKHDNQRSTRRVSSMPFVNALIVDGLRLTAFRRLRRKQQYLAPNSGPPPHVHQSRPWRSSPPAIRQPGSPPMGFSPSHDGDSPVESSRDGAGP